MPEVPAQTPSLSRSEGEGWGGVGLLILLCCFRLHARSARLVSSTRAPGSPRQASRQAPAKARKLSAPDRKEPAMTSFLLRAFVLVTLATLAPATRATSD